MEGFGDNSGDGTLMRRNPSKIVKANGEYHVWYTTGKDSFVWEEQRVALPRISKQTGQLTLGFNTGHFGLERKILPLLLEIHGNVRQARRRLTCVGFVG